MIHMSEISLRMLYIMSYSLSDTFLNISFKVLVQFPPVCNQLELIIIIGHPQPGSLFLHSHTVSTCKARDCELDPGLLQSFR